jgi:integrase
MLTRDAFRAIRSQMPTRDDDPGDGLSDLPALVGPTSLRLLPEEVNAELKLRRAQADAFRSQSVAKNTLINYQRAWNRFAYWAHLRGLESLPASPGTVEAYVMAAVHDGIPIQPTEKNPTPAPGKKLGLSALNLHLSAIAFVHEQSRLDNPCALLPKDVMKGLRRALGKPPEKAKWLASEQAQEAAMLFPDDLRGKRDRAILLVGFAAGGRRRSEVAALQVEQLEDQMDGSFMWTVPRSKTDQEGKGFAVPIPYLEDAPDKACPARALRDWMDAAGVEKGAIFCSIDRHGNMGVRKPDDPKLGIQGDLVSKVVKKAVSALGLDPTLYSAHSLRSGFTSSMARDGVPLTTTMQFSGHISVQTAQGYHQKGAVLSAEHPIKKTLNNRSRGLSGEPEESGEE